MNSTQMISDQLNAYAYRGICQRACAYKIGYAMTQTKYYSWLGGVRPDQRRQGLASELMERQHNWAAAQGYQLTSENLQTPGERSDVRIPTPH